VPIDALTLQNEPTVATSYPGMQLPAGVENELLSRYLAPALAAAGERPLLFGGDLGWGQENWPFIDTEIGGAAARDVSGIAWHCYFGSPTAMAAFHNSHPGLQEILDECSPGLITPTPTPEIVISSLREWASTVALWNLALDHHGGPVQPPNHGCPGCLGLVRISEPSHSLSAGVNFYELGQASAFVAPGAERIASNSFVSYRYRRPGVSVATPGLDDVALRNPDGSIVLIAYDNSSLPIRFAVAWRARELPYTLPAGATVTLTWNSPPASSRRAAAAIRW
jgi:glucosylceramidase